MMRESLLGLNFPEYASHRDRRLALLYIDILCANRSLAASLVGHVRFARQYRGLAQIV